MERILSAFKNLYKGEDVAKTHWLIVLFFILPCAAASVFRFCDKDTKEIWIPLLIVGSILLLLSIIPMFMLTGFNFKFLNMRLTDAVGLPKFDLDCIKIAIKLIPLSLVWGIYIGVPSFLYLGAVILVFVAYMSANQKEPLALIVGLCLMMLFLFLLIIPLFIITPFLKFINMKFAEKFEYTSDMFNPLTPFLYMKKAFKDSMITALKFVLVGMATSFAAQIVTMIFVIFIMVYSVIFALFVPENSNLFIMPGFVIPVIILSGICALVSAYVQFITAFAYSDNLMDVYKEKIRENV
ncbi:hypothetical protein HDR58_07385 [bacterium]|nr:hypothetical protein [bacterium]